MTQQTPEDERALKMMVSGVLTKTHTKILDYGVNIEKGENSEAFIVHDLTIVALTEVVKRYRQTSKKV
jgi:hypothetical protein